MQVQKFEVAKMSDAESIVKKEMGPDANIISAEKKRHSGIVGLFRKPYFIVTAVQLSKAPIVTTAEPAPSEKEIFQQAMINPLVEEVRRLTERIENYSAAGEPREIPDSNRTLAAGDITEIKNILLDALGKDRQVIDQGHQAVASPGHTLEVLEQIRRSLEEEEIGVETIELLVSQIQDEAADGADLEELRVRLAEALTSMIKCSGAIRIKKGSQQVLALVGPTGVGKTTTLAKLAAMYAVKRAAKVGLITMDTYRVGAVEQLKEFAKIMELPVKVASNKAELLAALKAYKGKDLILIDTAGRSPKASEWLEDMKELLSCRPGIETYLCMAATTRDKEIDQIIETFSALSIQRIIFTKLDESVSYGAMVNAHIRHKLPLSYFTTGQNVPDDIEVANVMKLASMVIKERQQ